MEAALASEVLAKDRRENLVGASAARITATLTPFRYTPFVTTQDSVSMEAVHHQGFAINKDVLSELECKKLLDHLVGSTIERSRAGARHLLSSFQVSALARDARLLAIAGGVLGGKAVPFRATLFDKSKNANWPVAWHQGTALPLRARFDAPGWGPWSTKAGVVYAHAPTAALERVTALRLHLDDSVSENGPLRVLPWYAQTRSADR